MLLNAYLNFGISLQNLDARTKFQLAKENILASKNPLDFFENGYKLALKYLGENDYFTKRFFE